MPRKALGKGLGALIPEEPDGRNVVDLPVQEIKSNPYQPRSKVDSDSLGELMNSIKEKGVVQPVVVRKTKTGYELIAGERRLRAVKALGYPAIPGIVREASDSEVLELALVENLQREDLNPLEEALAYKCLIDEFGLSHQEIGEKVGKERSTVTNRLRLLQLPRKIQQHLLQRRITEGHARALLMIANRAKQLVVCRKIIDKGLTVRDAERIANAKERQKREPDPDMLPIEEALRNRFSTKVKVVKGKRKGRIEIEFYSDSDLERILDLIGI